MAAKKTTRPLRWHDAIADARAALEKATAAAGEAVAALTVARDIQDELREWRDKLDDQNKTESATYEKLATICEIDLEPDEQDLHAIDSAISEAETADVPLGFGRD